MEEERQTPSSIRWSSFTNNRASSITELWPPYDFTRDAEVSTSPECRTPRSLCERLSSKNSNARSSHSSRESEEGRSRAKHESGTTRSLRRFVEREIGLGAIHTGRSKVDVGGDEAWVGSGEQRRGSATRRAVGKDGGMEAAERKKDGERAAGTSEKKRSRSLSGSIRKFFRFESGDEVGGEGLEVKLKILAKEMGSSVQKRLKKEVAQLGR